MVAVVDIGLQGLVRIAQVHAQVNHVVMVCVLKSKDPDYEITVYCD
jgi:hypothetical protein